MQTTTESGVLVDRGVHPIARLSWRAILAGSIASLSISWLLLSLGSAVGLSTIHPVRMFTNPANAAGFGVWMGVAVGIGSFLGGFISTRASSILDRADAMIQGLTTWAFGFLFSAVFAAFLATVGSAGALSGDVGRPGPGPAADRPERVQRRADAMDAGAGASWMVFASGLVGAICGMAGGAAGLRRREELAPTAGRGVPLGRPVEYPAT